ncbi:MAG TPA: alpha/beta hydrolase [Nitrospiraceae bacterium]|nr:alpha/beta hydrolase [Nitrospiraceae bacterium]
MKKMKDANGWPAINETAVRLTLGGLTLEAVLGLPAQALGVVAFAHGSGSGRFSPRNNFVARYLQHGSVATLLIDLLTPDEAEDRRKVFDIDLLADRVLLAKAWLEQDDRTKDLGIGYFGASTGAGAALQAAARDPSSILAVVSRGGRPDLAEAYLPSVTSPTLLIVGGDDEPVIEMNRAAYRLLSCPKRLVIVPRATHLFEEPGTLEEVAEHALIWFQQHVHPTQCEGTGAQTKERAL